MAVIQRRLNGSDIDLLEKIFLFGGYTTSVSVQNYRSDCTARGVRYILKKLADNGYLKKIMLYSMSDRYAHVYQATTKAVKIFDGVKSYNTREHEDTYIIRSLIKQHFLFETYKTFDGNVIADNERKILFLTKVLGCDIGLLPKKYSNSIPLTYMDECIINTAKSTGRPVICKSNGLMLYDDTNIPDIILAYVDKYTANSNTQVASLIERYKKLIELEKAKIGFLIIVDSERREESYIKALEKMQLSGKRTSKIHDSYIKLHMRILQDKLDVPFDEVRELPQKIKGKYSEVMEIITGDMDGIPVKEIRLGGFKTVDRIVRNILVMQVGREEKIKRVTEFFRKFYKLCAAGYFNKETDFDIKVYRIGYKFSVK
jgi:hypothetical protein